MIEANISGLKHSAALLGAGSEVLGFDTEMSTDHNWGPRVQLFLTPADCTEHLTAIDEFLTHALPSDFMGYPTNCLPSLNTDASPHHVTVHTIEGFFHGVLECDPSTKLEPSDWLSFSQHKLLSVTRGAVFRDDLGLEAARSRLAWYPHNLWLYLLACQWTRVGQESHLMGRAGLVGDEIGSMLIAARLVRDVMNLGFLMERQYAPYAKWFGTAFSRLNCAEVLLPHLEQTLRSKTWSEREANLCAAYIHLAELHNKLAITPPLPNLIGPFHTRPFQVINADAIAAALLAEIEDTAVQRIARQTTIGCVDQFSDNTDLIANTPRPRTKKLYEFS